MRKYGQEIIEATAGKKIHGTGAIPGGINRNLPIETARCISCRQIDEMDRLVPGRGETGAETIRWSIEDVVAVTFGNFPVQLHVFGARKMTVRSTSITAISGRLVLIGGHDLRPGATIRAITS